MTPAPGTVLVFGAGGQVGRALCARPDPQGRVKGLTRADADITQPGAVRAALDRHAPSVIVNAAAYTDVDAAEADEAGAFAVNAGAVDSLAREAAARAVLLIHLSTDFVFDGRRDTPYTEDDAAHPLSAYGRSKLAGEEAVTAASARNIVLRTASVFDAQGNNFVRTIIGLARKTDHLRVIDSQTSGPTPAAAVADAIAAVAARAPKDGDAIGGIYHVCGKPAVSRHAFARAIIDAASAFLPHPVTVEPVASYPTAAARPAYSVLDNRRFERVFGKPQPDWREALADIVAMIGEDLS